MLKDHGPVATIAVRDLDAAARFYEGSLGLARLEANSETITYSAGRTTLLVYRSQFAGTNQSTAATWPVGKEIDDVVKALGAKGVKFEHYDLPQLHREGDIHVAGEMRVAWFKDPDGNIHSLIGAEERNK